ncbi:MAG: exodeoxyribonuclease III [Calditrichaeota bacterium]|nr:exodeoxyribonuclease III [Calditrichota bacterium]
MNRFKLVSWNVNGIRAAIKKGFSEWLSKEDPDILGIQETKAHREQVDGKLVLPDDYYLYWNSAERKGYSGVAAFSKREPVSIHYGFNIDHFDIEGRVISLEYPEFTLLNIYFPNGQRDLERLQYKLDFYDATLEYCRELRHQGKKLIICGDFNTAHKEIDLKNPKENKKTSGFLPVERQWIDKFIAHGYVDIFRTFHPDEPGQYSWWTYRFNARARNIGWRIDYFFVSDDFVDSVKDAYIAPEVMGSDHCPVVLEVEV